LRGVKCIFPFFQFSFFSFFDQSNYFSHHFAYAALPLFALHCAASLFTSPKSIGFRFRFSNLDLVCSIGFAQSCAGKLCSLAPQLPISTKQHHLFHNSLANALRLHRLGCCSCLLVFLLCFIVF
jgi:hypothetical protein